MQDNGIWECKMEEWLNDFEDVFRSPKKYTQKIILIVIPKPTTTASTTTTTTAPTTTITTTQSPTTSSSKFTSKSKQIATNIGFGFLGTIILVMLIATVYFGIKQYRRKRLGQQLFRPPDFPYHIPMEPRVIPRLQISIDESTGASKIFDIEWIPAND